MIIQNGITGANVDRYRNFSVINISYDALAKILELPDNLSIVGTSDNFENNSISIKVIGSRKIHKEAVELDEIMLTPTGWE